MMRVASALWAVREKLCEKIFSSMGSERSMFASYDVTT
jgi:hypothetical protein